MIKNIINTEKTITKEFFKQYPYPWNLIENINENPIKYVQKYSK